AAAAATRTRATSAMPVSVRSGCPPPGVAPAACGSAAAEAGAPGEPGGRAWNAGRSSCTRPVPPPPGEVGGTRRGAAGWAMSGASRLPGDDGARARITALLAELGVAEPLLSVADLTARRGVVQGVLADRVVDLAVTESGRLRLKAELRGRRWAAEREVGVPE